MGPLEFADPPDRHAAVRTLLTDIPPDECEALLAATPLGRVGVIVGGRPEIFPVHHVFDERTGTVTFPTNVGTKLHAALEWPFVSFEIDGIGADGCGWSVLVVGRGELVGDDEVARLESQRHVLWRGGAATRWLRIWPTTISGRRISVAIHL